MGFFDIFTSSRNVEQSGKNKNVLKWEKIVSDRLAQTYERRDAIKGLGEIGTVESVSALLKRFSVCVEPSLDDQEEREQAFQAVVSQGANAISPILAYCEKAESLSWPLKMLETLLPKEDFFEKVLFLLKKQDADYSRNVEPKNQLISALENYNSEHAVDALIVFLEDVSEPTRYQAVNTLLTVMNERIALRLKNMMSEEESLRIKNKIRQAFEED